MSFVERTGSGRTPATIAAEILATEPRPASGVKAVSFERILQEILDPAYAMDIVEISDDSDPNATEMAIARQRGNFKQLLETLRRIRNGNASSLSDKQKVSIRESGILIGLLINHAEYMGGIGHDGSTSLDDTDKFKASVAHDVSEIPIDDIEQNIKQDYTEQAQCFAADIRSYNTKILPLLEELADALHIDKPRGGIG